MRRTAVVRRGSLVVALLLCATARDASAQTKRAMTVDDLLGAVRVGDPQLSPDGRRVLFVRTVTDLSTGKRNADIYSVPADGSGQPAPFITGPKGDDTPRFLDESGKPYSCRRRHSSAGR